MHEFCHNDMCIHSTKTTTCDITTGSFRYIDAAKHLMDDEHGMLSLEHHLTQDVPNA